MYPIDKISRAYFKVPDAIREKMDDILLQYVKDPDDIEKNIDSILDRVSREDLNKLLSLFSHIPTNESKQSKNKMKLSELKQIIREEIRKSLNEERSTFESARHTALTLLPKEIFRGAKVSKQELEKAIEWTQKIPQYKTVNPQELYNAMAPGLVEGVNEVTPPGREKQVKALKKVLPKTYTDPKTGERKKSSPWAVAWSSYKKGK